MKPIRELFICIINQTTCIINQQLLAPLDTQSQRYFHHPTACHSTVASHIVQNLWADVKTSASTVRLTVIRAALSLYNGCSDYINFIPLNNKYNKEQSSFNRS